MNAFLPRQTTVILASCTNTTGSCTCACDASFSGDGVTSCNDILRPFVSNLTTNNSTTSIPLDSKIIITLSEKVKLGSDAVLTPTEKVIMRGSYARSNQYHQHIKLLDNGTEVAAGGLGTH